jgi:hypothetical protein
MPQILGPNALEMGPLDELTKDGINAIAPARELAAQVWPGIVSATPPALPALQQVALPPWLEMMPERLH